MRRLNLLISLSEEVEAALCLSNRELQCRCEQCCIIRVGIKGERQCIAGYGSDIFVDI